MVVIHGVRILEVSMRGAQSMTNYPIQHGLGRGQRPPSALQGRSERSRRTPREMANRPLRSTDISLSVAKDGRPEREPRTSHAWTDRWPPAWGIPTSRSEPLRSARWQPGAERRGASPTGAGRRPGEGGSPGLLPTTPCYRPSPRSRSCRSSCSRVRSRAGSMSWITRVTC